jgi:hypothetical protein
MGLRGGRLMHVYKDTQRTNDTLHCLHVLPRAFPTSLPRTWRTCPRTPIRQLRNAEYDASGSCADQTCGTRASSRLLGPSCRAVRVRCYRTRVARCSHGPDLLPAEHATGIYADPGWPMLGGFPIRIGACMQVQVAVRAYKVGRHSFPFFSLHRILGSLVPVTSSQPRSI